MFSLPRNVFASGVKTFGDTMQELRDRSGARGGHGSDKSAKQRALEPVLLTAEEAALESEALLTEEAERLPRTILWQIGRSGRRDYEAKWTDEFDYWIGRDLDPIHSPAIPHLLMAKGGPKAGGATEQLNIHFTLTREYPERGLVLIFDRWGAEKDEVRVDGELLAPVGGAGEGKFRHVALSLRGLSSGDHVITITTTGATGSEGHRIDSIMLAALDEPAKR